MSRRHLYSVEQNRPTWRNETLRPLRLHLRWNGHEQAYVHQPSGSTLEGLIYAAKKRGYTYALSYPADRRCTFELKPRS